MFRVVSQCREESMVLGFTLLRALISVPCGCFLRLNFLSSFWQCPIYTPKPEPKLASASRDAKSYVHRSESLKGIRCCHKRLPVTSSLRSQARRVKLQELYSPADHKLGAEAEEEPVSLATQNPT